VCTREESVRVRCFPSNRVLADHIFRTGASRVLPVVHITRRKDWKEVRDAEQDLPDLAPVTAPAPNRSGEQTFVPPLTIFAMLTYFQ
jgi:hypothetical protein